MDREKLNDLNEESKNNMTQLKLAKETLCFLHDFSLIISKKK